MYAALVALAFERRATMEALRSTHCPLTDDVMTRTIWVAGSPLVTVAGCDGCLVCVHPNNAMAVAYIRQPSTRHLVEVARLVSARLGRVGSLELTRLNLT